MNNIRPNQGPRRTTTREANERSAPRSDINVMGILSDRHPARPEDYAIQLFYRANKHNPFFYCAEKRMDINMENAYLTINGAQYNINIRTGVIVNN